MSARQKIMKAIMQQPLRIKPQIREAQKKNKWNIVRGDTVQVIGKHPESGKQGIILEVNRKNDRVTVEGVNMYTKIIKGDAERGVKDRSIKKERTIHYSNVNLVDPVTSLPTRIVKRYLEDGTKVRVSKRSGAVIPKPEILTVRKRPVSQVVTDKDTADEHVWASTYEGYKRK